MVLVEVKLNDGIKVFTRDIIFITRENRKTLAYLTGSRVIHISESLSLLEEQLNGLNNNLNGKMFFRSHKSYLVNIKMVNEIIPDGKEKYQLIMNNTDKRPLLASQKKKDLEQKLKLFAETLT